MQAVLEPPRRGLSLGHMTPFTCTGLFRGGGRVSALGQAGGRAAPAMSRRADARLRYYCVNDESQYVSLTKTKNWLDLKQIRLWANVNKNGDYS